MREMPLSIGTLHFVGIGGIGMSGIAEVLHNLGYSVTGSDISDSANVKRLRALGIAVAIGHRAENIGDSAVVVISSAVRLAPAAISHGKLTVRIDESPTVVQPAPLSRGQTAQQAHATQEGEQRQATRAPCSVAARTGPARAAGAGLRWLGVPWELPGLGEDDSPCGAVAWPWRG